MLILLWNATFCGLCLFLSPGRPGWLWGGMLSLGVLTLQAAQFYRQSRSDDLTGLNNLRRLEDMERIYRGQSRLGVWFFDLDHLKQVNDFEGHTAGDRLLKDFAAVLSGAEARKAMAYRVGGDEFLLILPDPDGAAPPLPGLSAFAASWGFAAGDGSTLRELIVRAEQEMYRKRMHGESYGF